MREPDLAITILEQLHTVWNDLKCTEITSIIHATAEPETASPCGTTVEPGQPVTI